MNGDVSTKKAAVNKVKQVASAATSAASTTATAAATAANGGNKKRRKDLKPIITGEGSPSQGSQGSNKR
jgi:serine/threonine-protein kinase SRPK3